MTKKGLREESEKNGVSADDIEKFRDEKMTQEQFIELVISKMPREQRQQEWPLKSKGARALLWKMMRGDPKQRPTALEILEEEWVVEGHPEGRLCDPEEKGEAAYTGTLASNELDVVQVELK